MLAAISDVQIWATFGWFCLSLLCLNALAAMIATALRLNIATFSDAAQEHIASEAPMSLKAPFFSIHIPTHDEPPEMVMATLRALARLDWPDWEVIVIDNNTPDQRTWQPVEAYCEALGPRFRFYHRDGIIGAKAGALNIALECSNPRTTHVAIVDADYHVLPDFLAQASAAFATYSADYVQFPQAYSHSGDALSVVAELGDYFCAHAPAANLSHSMLLTGTLSAIDKNWLTRVGGWPTGTITEDAELGMMLFRAGARGVFVNRVVGHGMLPLDFAGLATQRERWVAGNMQTLAAGLARRWSAAPRGQLSVFTQLLAWPGFLGFPVLALVGFAMLRLWQVPEGPWADAEALATGTIAFTLAAMAFECAMVKRQPEALTVKLSLVWSASLAWLPLLWRSRPRFRRTPKSANVASALPRIMIWGSVIMIAGAAVLWATGAPYAAIALLLPLLSLPAAVLVDGALRAAASTVNYNSNNRCADALSHCHSNL